MIVICGSGILGLSLARELLKKGYEDIVIIEKEEFTGFHASGRNSGVLHAGIYYTPDSLKAKFCIRGNSLMKEYCKERKLPLRETGKVIVTKKEDEIKALEELYRRAVSNGATVKFVDEKELKEIEPYAKTVGKAIYSPLTAVVDPKAILNSLVSELKATGRVKFMFNTKFLGLKNSKEIKTSRGNIKFDVFINCAGAYADKVAHSFGIGHKYKIIPFKGIYKKLKAEKSYLVRGNIYPVPDIRNPFLGVHFTKDIRGAVYIGPTAIPAFGRENYGILKGIDLEALKIIIRDSFLLFKNKKFRRTALDEVKKYSSFYFFRDVKDMLDGVRPEDIEASNKVGIRPQLVDWENKELVMDFLVLKDGDSVHILNAISPAFTSSFAFAEYIVKEYIQGGG
jgi:L-2-hydroxyglutarate oxidase LhgO